MKKQTSPQNLLYGIQAIEEILNDPSKIQNIEKIFADEKKQHALRSVLNKARQHKIVVQYVPKIKLNKLSRNQNHQGIVAQIVTIQYHSLAHLLHQTNQKYRLFLVLDRITDVRNFGAIARSAFAMGADALIIPAKNSAPINADAIKTSAGALLKIPVCKETNLQQSLQLLKNKEFQLIACHEKTSRLIYEVDFTKPTAIILGSEHNGIRKEYLQLCHAEAKIPMPQPFDSLNVSVSAGIVLYEIVRQKQQSPTSHTHNSNKSILQ